MSYQAPSIGPAGLSIPTYSDILGDLVQNFQTIYGTTVYLANDSADYQWISIVAKRISDTLQAIQLAYANRSPLSAIGGGLDGVVKINGIARKVATYSTASLTLTGTAGNTTTITNGVVQDVNRNLWLLPATVAIPPSGSIIVVATCQIPGPVTANANTINSISTPTAGWLSANNPAAAVVGTSIETDSQLRGRQALSTVLPSQTMVDGTIAALWTVPGVTRVSVEENPTSATDANGCPPHSITCVVEGGDNYQIALMIYNNRSIGCYTNGTIVMAITDPNNGGAVMNIRFNRPTYVQIYVSLSVHGLANFTSNTQVAIQNAIINYLNTLQIGETVVYSELYGAALTVRPDPTNPMFSIKALTVGTAASPTGTSDIVLAYNQAAQCAASQVVITTV